ncbi:MAG TPA: methylated-DNA--[protein]-cysteine S-methyltransferase [Methanomicrobiales archaeon]|nr:methylated-DNA--[protein]-cysteine S-methyltransferase [Methanomicrobiales archaeon]
MEGNLGPVASEIQTAFGKVRLVWVPPPSGPKVRRIVLPVNGRPGNREMEELPVHAVPDGRIGTLAEAIQAFLDGQDVNFDLGILDWDRCPPFQRRVLLAEHAIPRGYVSTYGRIAAHLGKPKAGRAVGNALARNPFPIVIPCHRALRSDGSLGGFQGGPAMKRRLLEMEGVRFRGDGRVTLERVWY